MISYRNALSIIEEIALSRKVSSEIVPLDAAMGRILATSALSKEEVPSFTNSAMDGFAVSTVDTFGATLDSPIKIFVDGLIAAGDLDSFKKACSEKSKGAVEIMTGAPVPNGRYDAVVRIEDVTVERDSDGRARFIVVSRPSKTGDNIRLKGTDYNIGQVVLTEGTRMSPEHILACASLGITEVSVRHRPRIAIVSTGSELVPPDTVSLEPGMIRNSTGPFLLSALKNFGADARYLGILADDPSLYRKILEQALEDGTEIVISTGAVSMGKYDFVPEVLREMGAITHFHKASIRPGKPVLFAEFGQSRNRPVFFGVPGNPVSTAVGLRFFVEPYLRALFGLPREQPIQAYLSRDCQKPNGLRCFFKGRTKLSGSGMEVEALKGQASYVVSALLDANCWVVLPEDGNMVSARTAVDIFPLPNAFERGVLG